MKIDMSKVCGVMAVVWLGLVPGAAFAQAGGQAPAVTTTPQAKTDPKQEEEARKAAAKKAEEERKKAADAAKNQPRPAATVAQRPAPVAPPPVQPPPPVPGYAIGPDDVLSIVYWKDKDMTTDVQVRPDGKISLALLNDVDAAGLTPDQLRAKLVEASKEFFEDANITVVVKEIKSRRVFILGQVAKTGPYPLTGPLTVTQLIALAGGVAEFADVEKIGVVRVENGKQSFFKVNLKEVQSGKKLQQNILLQPGDTVTVP